MKRNSLALFVMLSRPVLLLGGIGLTFLGAGIARYLGNSTNWNLFWLGLFWMVLVQLSAHYLNEYFDAPIDQFNENRTIFSGGSGAVGPGEDKLRRRTALSAFVGATSLAAALVLIMLWTQRISPTVGILMLLIYLGGMFYSLPPLQLSRSGYGEFAAAIVAGYLVPMLSYNLQTGELHRLVALSSLPIVLLLMVFLLAGSFPDYATDLKYGKRNFLVRAGWQNVVVVHNTLILLAFVVLAALWFFGFPRAILLPTFLTFPLGILQFWQMRLITAGAKPNWRNLTLNAAALVGMVIYLLSYFFWTR
jgi:1,4-dihydroxy-2-naphthoate octaprenyltransferase